MRIETTTGLLIAALSLCFSPSLRADESSAADEDARKRDAKERLNRGNELLRERQYEGALREYEAAYQAFASPKIRLNIAEAHFQLGDWVSAYENYEAFLAEAPGESELHGAARARKAELEAKISFLEIQSPIDGASVAIDGKARGETPIERMALNPGRHTVVAEKSGYQRFEASEVLTTGETKTLMLALVSNAPPPVLTKTESVVESDDSSVLEKWWYWAIVGGVVVVGAGVAIAATTGGSDFLPSGELGTSGTSTWERL